MSDSDSDNGRQLFDAVKQDDYSESEPMENPFDEVPDSEQKEKSE